MEFFIFIFIILVVILVFSLSPNKKQEINNFENESKTLRNVNPNVNSPYDYLNYLKNAEQKEIDSLKDKNYEEEIKDYILKRAFIHRWRFEKLDYDYYKEMLEKRDEKGKYDINKITNTEKKPRKKNILKKTFEVKGAFVSSRKIYIIENVLEGDKIIFREEPSNKIDDGAIKILHNKNKIGYVAVEDQIYINQLLIQNYSAKIHKINIKGKYIDVFYKIESCEKYMM